MSLDLRELFGVEKPVVAMAHLPPLPGTPLYDEVGGANAIVESVARDVEILTRSGFDAVLFCNEGDRPEEVRRLARHARPLHSACREPMSFQIERRLSVSWQSTLKETA
jgi:predicted TIM-barrel enzyme